MTVLRVRLSIAGTIDAARRSIARGCRPHDHAEPAASTATRGVE
ncbi:hypothetical protein OB905_09265 [Halobacteria archaeon AArc-dxtr1]|nr:hypothetical protein [Halobacteria archaeon AArc-dxtr1]